MPAGNDELSSSLIAKGCCFLRKRFRSLLGGRLICSFLLTEVALDLLAAAIDMPDETVLVDLRAT